MRLTLLLLGALIGTIIAVQRHRNQTSIDTLYEESRRNRVRILNQNGEWE